MAIDNNVPVATNQMAADLAAMLTNTRMIVCGDGTAGRVLRLSQLKIENGTAEDTIKCTMSSVWNGDTIAAQDNIPYDNTLTGKYTYRYTASLSYMTIDSTAFSGNIKTILNITAYTHNLTIPANVSGISYGGTNMLLYFYNANTGNPIPLHTQLVGVRELTFNILYLTDA